MSFIIARLVYIVANVVDYLFTISGVAENPLREGNPIIQGYITHFGAVYGILLCKALACIGVLFAMKVIHIGYKENRTRVRAEYILYGGAILMTLGGCMWLFG